MVMKATKNPPQAKPLFSQQAIADRAGASQSLVSRMIARGELDQHLQDGKLLESAVEAVRAHVVRDEQTSESTDELKHRIQVAETRLKEAQAQLREIELA